LEEELFELRRSLSDFEQEETERGHRFDKIGLGGGRLRRRLSFNDKLEPEGYVADGKLEEEETVLETKVGGGAIGRIGGQSNVVALADIARGGVSTRSNISSSTGSSSPATRGMDGCPSSSGRHWVFTVNRPDEYCSCDGPGSPNCTRLWDALRLASTTLAYAVCQLERAPETGRRHLQGYVEFSGTVRFARLQKVLAGVHFEQRRGTRDQAREYCRKSESRDLGPWEFGSWKPPVRASRDRELPSCTSNAAVYDKIRDDIISRKTQKEIASDNFSVWCRHYRAFDRFEGMTALPRTVAPEVYILAGLPGTGKSTFARTLAPDEQIYDKAPSKWWDGYTPYYHDVGGTVVGHKVVVFDDYAGSLAWTDWKLLCDRYKYQPEIKGGHILFNSPIVIFTTNRDPVHWYKWEFDPSAHLAMKRRVTHWIIFEKVQMNFPNGDYEYKHFDYGPGQDGWTKFDEHLKQILVFPTFKQKINED